MKKRGYILLGVLGMALAGCEFPFGNKENNNGENQTVDQEVMTGVSFNDAQVTYDGANHSIEVTGLPEGAVVTYGESGNTFKEVGEHVVTATVTCEGYKDLTLTAKLTIVKADFAGLTFAGATVPYDGKEHKIEVAGSLPEGASVSYGAKGNAFTAVGTYEITATVSCAGYNDLVLNATLKITALDFKGITFADDEVIYDGQAHEIAPVIPEMYAGASVSYGEGGNSFVNAGVHQVTATISLAGYNNLTVSAKLTITAADFEGITFTDTSVDYDGQAHEIAPVIPEKYQGATVTYGEAGNSFVDAGEHEVTATISLAGYNDLTVSAKLTINKIDYADLSLVDATVDYDGQAHTIALTGELPEGASFSYVEGYKGGTYPGTYTIKGVVSGANHNDLNLSATLTIKADAAEEALVVGDFEGMSSNDLVDEWELQYYNNGWVTPSSASIAIAKNQIMGSGSSTMKLNLSHQGQAFKVTKSLSSKTYKKYNAIALDTLIDNYAEGGTSKVQVQLWLKDLPLPEAYAGYKDTYVTYTLDAACPSNWTHWEIPLDDASMSIASGAIPAEALGQLGLTAEDLSLYIDKVAVLVTPNYVNGGPKSYAYIDNVQLIRAESKVKAEYVNLMNRVYTIASTDDTVFKLTLKEGSNASTFETLNLEENIVLPATAVVSGSDLTLTTANDIVFKMKASRNGAVLDYTADPSGSGVIALAPYTEHIDFTGKSFAEVISVENFESYSATGIGYDQAHGKAQASGLRKAFFSDYYSGGSGSPVGGNGWSLMGSDDYLYLETSNAHSGSNAGNFKNSTNQMRFMSYGLSDGTAKELGRGKYLSLWAKASQTATINVRAWYINQVTPSNQGDTSSCALVSGAAVTTEWTQIIVPLTETRNVYGIDIRNGKQGGRIYIDDVEIIGEGNPWAAAPEKPEPVVARTITDGTFGVVAGTDVYDLTISGDVTSAVFGKHGEEGQALSAEMANSKVVLKDTVASGAGLTVELDIGEDGALTISSVTGAASSPYSAFNGAKLVKYQNVNEDFQNLGISVDTKLPLTGAGFEQFKWNNAYVPLTQSQMNYKSSGSNKFINLYTGYGTAYKYVYTPAAGAIGPANKLAFKYANNYNASTMNIKVSVTKMDGTEVFLKGSSGAWDSVAANEGDRNGTWAEFDFDLELGLYKSVSIYVKSALNTAYFYIDDLFAGYKAEEITPEPPVAKTISDGRFFIWNGEEESFTIDISDNVTKAHLTKISAKPAESDFSVGQENGVVTLKDTTAAGAGLTIKATIQDDGTLKVTEVTGLAASDWSGSILNKTAKPAECPNLTFDDGTTGSGYSSPNWTVQKYGGSGWETVNTNQAMNSRAISGNKIVNMKADSTSRNFIYSNGKPFGPVHHLKIDLGNYFTGGPKNTIKIKIKLLDQSGNVKGIFTSKGEDAFQEIAFSSTENVLNTFEFDCPPCVPYALRITTQTGSSSASYLYVDNIVLS